MSEMDEKLNTLLSDPSSMARIMQLAQQLSGTMGGAEKSTPEPPPPPPAAPADQAGGGTAGFGGSGGLDPALLGKLLPLAQEYGRSNSASMQLLNALRPFLKPEKQGKVERGGTSGKAHPSGGKNSCRNGRDSVYNRYIRNEQGAYSRIPQQEPAPGPVSGRPPPPPPSEPPPPGGDSSPGSLPPGGPPPKPQEPSPRPPEGRFLDRLLSRLHLGDIDSGDLLLLLILFFLFREEADEEVLIAIGLLLIL